MDNQRESELLTELTTKINKHKDKKIKKKNFIKATHEEWSSFVDAHFSSFFSFPEILLYFSTYISIHKSFF